jgi:hypothetical protein
LDLIGFQCGKFVAGTQPTFEGSLKLLDVLHLPLVFPLFFGGQEIEKIQKL